MSYMDTMQNWYRTHVTHKELLVLKYLVAPKGYSGSLGKEPVYRLFNVEQAAKWSRDHPDFELVASP